MGILEYFNGLSKKKIIIFAVLLLGLISLATNYSGHVDIKDYAGVAKFFSGSYNAKIRTSHSMFYGIIHSPLISLFESFWVMKLTSVLWLFLIILSVYYISGRNRKTLLLVATSPIIWYMGPWISPIQLSVLLFLWGFFFINKFNRTLRKDYLMLSGILFGLSWVVWNTVLFFIIFIIICFFYNRNVNQIFVFLFFVLIGFLPRLVLDLLFYGFPFYTSIKFFFAVLGTIFYGGIYHSDELASNSLLNFLTFILMFPVFIHTLFSRKIFLSNKRQIIFLILGFILIAYAPQIRYVMFLWPILIIYLGKSLNEKQFKIQLVIFIVMSLLVIAPYVIQMKYDTNAKDFTSAVVNFGKWEINSINEDSLILEDLNKITEDYPDLMFVVGNKPDSYSHLAMIYWGQNVDEFISMQDYNLFLRNESSLFEKKIKPTPKIADRRQIWFGGGMQKPENDNTDYDSIEFGIGIAEPINIEGFELAEQYDVLYLSKKV